MQAVLEQLELSDWLEQYPLLQQAHSLIRSHQHPDHWNRLDRIAQRTLRQFEQSIAAETLFGADLVVGIDTLFKSLQSVAAVPRLFNQLPVPASLAAAWADIAHLSQFPLTLLTAVRLELAQLMIVGHEHLAIIDSTLADRWFKIYQHTVTTYLRQQSDHTSLALSLHQPCLSASFEWATDYYTTRFDETSALPMYVLGVVSFSPHASHNLFDALDEILPPLNQLLRLAHDVAYDPKAMLNAGIFAYASEYKLSLAQAGQHIHASRDIQRDISYRMMQSFCNQLEQTQQFIDTAAAVYPDQAWLLEFSQDVMNASRDMTQKWKPC